MNYLERRIPADVPLHRGRVGAMRTAISTLPPTEYAFIAYVYRGAGEDLLTPNFETNEEIAQRQVKERAAREKRDAKREAQREAARAHRAVSQEARRLALERMDQDSQRSLAQMKARRLEAAFLETHRPKRLASPSPISLDDIEALLAGDDDD